MLRSANQLASSGCRVGRSLASRAQLGVSPPAFQPPVLAGRQAGLCRTHINISRSSMTCTSAFHRAGHHHHIAAACGASMSMSRRGLPVGAGKSRLAGVGDLGLTMAATRGILTGPFSGPFSPGSTSSPKRPEALPSGEKPALINRYIEPPEDGLKRYPTFRSPQGVLRGLDYLGTTVFAISGTVTAGQVGMDLLDGRQRERERGSERRRRVSTPTRQRDRETEEARQREKTAPVTTRSSGMLSFSSTTYHIPHTTYPRHAVSRCHDRAHKTAVSRACLWGCSSAKRRLP
ncbi:unnamed protein product [Ectocarpus sp. 12 AP-2014]